VHLLIGFAQPIIEGTFTLTSPLNIGNYMDTEKSVHHASAVNKLTLTEAKHVMLSEKFKSHEHKTNEQDLTQDLPLGQYRPIVSKGEQKILT
jgi:hypothetical protein